MHGSPKVRRRPGADTGVLVWRQIGRVNRAERRCDAQAAGILLAATRGVASHAVAGQRKIGATRHQAVILYVDHRHGDVDLVANIEQPYSSDGQHAKRTSADGQFE